MKRIILTLGTIAATAVTLTNCKKAEITPAHSGEFAIIASASDTKTTNDGLKTVWASGDALNVFHAAAGAAEYGLNDKFTVSDIASGRFEGTLGEELAATNDWYALYPYNVNVITPAATTKGYLTVGGKSQKQQGNNSKAHLAGTNMPLYAVAKAVAAAETPNLTMHQLCSVIEVKVKNSTSAPLAVNSVSFTGTEDICGTYYIDITGATPVYTASGANYVYPKVELSVTGAVIPSNEVASYFIAIKPFSASEGTLKLAVNGLEKSLNLTSAVTFTAGRIKTLNFTYDDEPESLPSVDNSVDPYTCGFESAEGFTAGSSYNNATPKVDGHDGAKWSSVYGTASTNAALAGSNSMQCRWYTSAATTFGYAQTEFTLTKVGHVSFKAAATNNLKVALYYKTTSDWVLADTFDLTTSSAKYSYTPSTVLADAQLRFVLVTPDTKPTATSNIRIDDVSVSAEAPAAPVLTSISVSGQKTKFTKGDTFAFGGTVTALYSDESTKNVTSSATFSGYDMANAGTQTVIVKYSEGAIEKTASYDITVSAGAVPFEWSGGDKASLTGMTGVTAYGLGSDYAASNAPYRVKLDTTGDYVIIEVGFEIQSVQLTVKMLGGANTSSIAIQESTAKDGTFTDVQTMTISGAMNDVVDFTTTNAFKSGSRAVKLYFTKGSNVGLGYIKITPKE